MHLGHWNGRKAGRGVRLHMQGPESQDSLSVSPSLLRDSGACFMCLRWAHLNSLSPCRGRCQRQQLFDGSFSPGSIVSLSPRQPTHRKQIAPLALNLVPTCIQRLICAFSASLPVGLALRRREISAWSMLSSIVPGPPLVDVPLKSPLSRPSSMPSHDERPSILMPQRAATCQLLLVRGRDAP